MNMIKCGCEKCVSSVFHQSDLNKWRLSELLKLDKLYIDYESTRLLHISNIDIIEYNIQIFPNNAYIYSRACDAASS